MISAASRGLYAGTTWAAGTIGGSSEPPHAEIAKAADPESSTITLKLRFMASSSA
jgi:hypothetical protein